jgi:hypothetical protein
MPELSLEELAELRTTLSEVPGWQLGDEVWARLDALVEQLHAALQAGDPIAARRAWAAIEHVSPRAARTSLTRPVGTPPWLREQVNRLVDAIDLRLLAPETSGGQQQSVFSKWTAGQDGRGELHAGDAADPSR